MYPKTWSADTRYFLQQRNFLEQRKKRKCCTNAKTAKADEIVYCAFQPLSLEI